MNIKLSKHPFCYWGDLHSHEWFDSHHIPDTWISIVEVGEKFRGKTLTMKRYLYIENLYIKTILSFIKTVGIRQMRVREMVSGYPIPIMVKDDSFKEPIQLGTIQTDEIRKFRNSIIDIRSPFFPLLLRLGIHREIAYLQLYDVKDYKTRITIGDDMYFYLRSPKITDLSQLYIPKELHAHSIDYFPGYHSI